MVLKKIVIATILLASLLAARAMTSAAPEPLGLSSRSRDTAINLPPSDELVTVKSLLGEMVDFEN
ncbi:MAG: hypothetical protein NTZ26_02525, partial [Candidatus Aminicenantes bacterium]|nr:hypothetical protein [Candidatus Aminicenantes bacterium]